MVSDEMQWPAPAKLNLFLHVTGRRQDGYHELQTLFQLIDLNDTVSLTVREDGRIERPSGPVGHQPGLGPGCCGGRVVPACETDLSRGRQPAAQVLGCPSTCSASYPSRTAVAGPDQGRLATRCGVWCWP